MKTAVFNQKGEKVRDLELPKGFDVKVSPEALTLYVNYIRAALREPIANSKDRSEVSGGGKKPWKQKGTGRARHGSSRSPLWVGGGVTFGPSNEQNFKLRINKNLKKKVIISAIADAFRDDKACVIENLTFGKPKTSDATTLLSNVSADGKIAVIFTENDNNADLSFRNIAGVNLMMPQKLNVINLLTADKVVMSEESINKIIEIFIK